MIRTSPNPLLDGCSLTFNRHIKRVLHYMRPSDYVAGTAIGLFGPSMMLLWERISPSHVGKGGFAPIMRLSGAIGVVAAFIYATERSTSKCPNCDDQSKNVTHWVFTVRFYGFRENQREIDMDMREMVDKVKKGEPLYGKSSLSPHLQGVASRNSRYSGVFLHVLPWYNFVNHDQASHMP
jgi:hypothetical protein